MDVAVASGLNDHNRGDANGDDTNPDGSRANFGYQQRGRKNHQSACDPENEVHAGLSFR
jgi:hypothetical protein